jgi:translation initiation factor IF-3
VARPLAAGIGAAGPARGAPPIPEMEETLINRDMRGGDNRSRETRINERIRAREVRVIDEDGQMLGVMTSFAALQMARERNLDLVEVSPQAVPPVCKIMDWGRYKYEQSKRESEARKHQKVTQLREIRLAPRTAEHDIAVKVRKIQEFLVEGDKVKVSVVFRGREMAHPEIGRVLLEEITQAIKGTATVERPPLMEGRMMSMIVAKGTGSETARPRPAEAQPRVARPATADAAAPAPAVSATAPSAAAPSAAAPVPTSSAPAAEAPHDAPAPTATPAP